MGRLFTRKRLFKLHGWLGLNLGWLLFVVCFSGTVAVFTPELDRALDPLRRVEAPTGAGPASWGVWRSAVQEAYPEASILSLQRNPGPRSAAAAMIRHPSGDFRVVFIDPYTAEVRGQRSQLDLKSFVRIFHKQFYLVPDEVGFHGTLLVGWFGVLLFVSAATGLYAFKHWWRALYTIRPGKGARVFWSDLHRSFGAWALLLTIVIAATGIWYLVEKNLEVFGLADHEAAPIPLEARPEDDASPPPGFDELVARAQAAYPELRIDALSLPFAPDRPLIAIGRAEAFAVRDRANFVAVDPRDGHILRVQRGSELPVGERLEASMDPLHFGTFGGLASRLVWFAGGLAMSLGILAGALVYLRRVRRALNEPIACGRAWAASLGFALLVAVASVYLSVHYIREAQLGIEAPVPGAIATNPDAAPLAEPARPEVPPYVYAGILVFGLILLISALLWWGVLRW